MGNAHGFADREHLQIVLSNNEDKNEVLNK